MVTPEPLPRSDARATIVIAEDDTATRMLLRQVLAREHFRVVAVENGRLACEAVRRERPDLVLLDWLMPIMDGREALAELKAAEETRGIPIVMLSSHCAVGERISALQAGVQDFLPKPFDPRELVARIEQQMRWRDRLADDADDALRTERKALAAASERRYRLLAEAMPHIVWVAGPRGEFRYFNRVWHDYTDTTRFDPKSGWSFALHPDDRAATLRAWSLSLATGRPFERQQRLCRAADGMYRWHLTRAIALSDERGMIAEWVGSCSDIHDYKIASETRAILDTIGSNVAIRADDGFVDYANPYWTASTGASCGSALGFGWRDYVHPDDVAALDRSRAPVGESEMRAGQYELRIRDRGGEYRWFLGQTALLPRAPGAPRRWLDTSTDIDDLKRLQSALATSETRYRALTDSMPQMVWLTDDAGRFEYVNHRWSEYTGCDLAATENAGLAAIVHREDLATLAAIYTSALDCEYTCEARFRHRDGGYRWHAVRAVVFHDACAVPRWIGTATDVEESKRAAAILASTTAELEHLAHHDPMTNLANRVLMLERLGEAIALAQRAKAEVIVLYLDLDRFKIVNDTLGHAAGDRVLTVTAARIAGALRAGDTASRVGGDEFVLVCATAEAAEDAARLATRLIDAVGEPIDIEGEPVTIGASVGISMYPTDGRAGEELIRKADSAMFSAKQSGRNRFAMYHAPTHSTAVAALDLESELNAAIAARDIVVHYQPVLSLHTKRVVGAEALVRWRHPHRGLVPPEDFLAFASSRRLIGAIGGAVLDAVCAELAALEPSVSAEFRISMNASAEQLLAPRFVSEVMQALAVYGASPSRLQIEVAEHSVAPNSDAVLIVLRQLAAQGISIAIDGYGIGSSSLAALKNFPLAALKIARVCIRDIANDAGDRAVAKTIITLAHGLGLSAVATGVETASQIAALRDYGSDAFQGYFASRPLPAAEFRAYLGRSMRVLPPA